MSKTDLDSEQPAVRWGAATDVGLVRVGNEDNFVAEPMVFAVADGMGGHQAGEVASDIAARIMRDRLTLGASNVGVVVASVVEANASIYQAAHASVDHHGMGTTLTAMVVLRDLEPSASRFALVNVGDSRTYLLRNGTLHRATVDHSYVQELVNTGHISEDEARSHPRRNIVTRALGIEPTVRVDTWLVPMVHGDRFILCSDGLVDEVHDEDIASIAGATTDPQTAAEQLVAKAKSNGGRDNVTVVVVDVLRGVASTSAAAELESEPGWPGSDSTTTMIDADAASNVGSGSSLFAAVDTETMAEPATEPSPAQPSPNWGAKRFLKLLGGAAALTVVATLIAVAVHNSNTDAPPPTPTTLPTIPTTSSSTSSTTAPSTNLPSTSVPSTSVPSITNQPVSSNSLVTSISSP
jgi:protein phosphatase